MTQKFGKYEVVRKIGSGGYGDVYEALDPTIGRRVAIKTCHAPGQEARARFIQEARLAGNLHHRNLTTLYDFGSEEDGLYLVCEFLPGEDLDAILARGKSLSMRERVEILIGVAYGLGHAHDAGIVHRDIKPANIRVLPDGTVKIMDFGIAKFLYAERTLTRTGFTVGTSSYLAPEQVRGEAIDRRTDIFAFGVLAYELLSSRKPFTGSSPAAILEAVTQSEPAPLEQVASQAPGALVRLVHRALRKNPDQRYPSMEPIRRELLAIREQLSPSAPDEAPRKATDSPAPEAQAAASRQAPSRTARWPLIASLIIAAALVSTLFFLLAHRLGP